MAAPPRSSAPPEAGLASVATVSFLASRAAPTGGFVIALAGGTAMARAGQRLGARRGYGASIAAMLESVAIMGPARFGVPLTQAASAPMMGALEARGVHPLLQGIACGLIRLAHNTLATAFFIWVILGGLDAYAGSYDTLLGDLAVLPSGEAAALALTGAGLAGWALFATTVQVVVYRRGLAAWPEDTDQRERKGSDLTPGGSRNDGPMRHRALDPRAATLAAAIVLGLLVASTAWALLAGVCAWLALAAPAGRGSDRTVLATGAVLTALLGGSALVASLVAGLGADLALRRALRAALLVLVATWLRAAAGSEGLREVARRSLGRMRRLPAMPEAAAVLERLGSDRRLVAAGRGLLGALGPVRKRPLPVLDAVLGWVASHSGSFVPDAPGARTRLSARPLDALLVLAAALPAAGLALA
ncbi:MAG: hypothetical protein WD844_09330 [Thermoleophilaceae bacterium]